jgi:hypothetical protein
MSAAVSDSESALILKSSTTASKDTGLASFNSNYPSYTHAQQLSLIVEK